MSVLLEVFGKRGYDQFRLPPVRNADYSIVLPSEVFLMEEPLPILLENVDDCWFIKTSFQYFLKPGGRVRRKLQPGDSFDLGAASGEDYTLIVSEIPSRILSFGKYLTKESITIGRSEENDIIILSKRAVSREHARILYTKEGWRIYAKSINGLYVNDVFVESSSTLFFGDHINIMGLRLVFLVDYLAVETGESGVVVRLTPYEEIFSSPEYPKKPNSSVFTVVHRAPRSIKEPDLTPIVIDAPPERQRMSAASTAMSVVSTLLMSIPMAGGTVFMIYASRQEGRGNQLYMYSGLVMAALTLVTGLIWVFIQAVCNRRQEKAQWEECSKAYTEYLCEKEDLIRARSDEIRSILENSYVSARMCAIEGAAEEISTDVLWTRTPYHRDFLFCRLGTGDMKLPAEIEIPEDHFSLTKSDLSAGVKVLREKYRMLTSVPMLVSLEENTQVGLAAESERERLSLARSMIIQFALCNCYTETKIGVIYDEERSSMKGGWDYLRWLPHVWTQSGDFRLLASNQEEARKLFHRLVPLIQKREHQRQKNLPVYILFIEAPHFLEGEPIERYLTKRENQCGLSVVWLAGERELLPRSCEFIIEKNETFRGWYHLMKGERTRIDFDTVTQEMADAFSRRLSRCRVQENVENSDIPSTVTFLEMLGTESFSDLDITGFWKKNRVMDTLRAPVGLKAGGKKKYLDIHEKYHGPHGLVAGTTGSGKSELLQSYLLSLLLLYGPDSVNLFLIDYKGGGMAGMFDGIPHLSGQISNLSGSQIYRAMTALKSENQRRQKLFARYQVNNINDYMRLWYDRGDMEPMPHLLIIIDEFAELKKEEPDFMQGLISVAQVGRSLGLHLILATQKPGGVVDDKIWSNSRFRMCLRVQDRQDSMEMLHKPDAADILQTGRCCFQVGNDEIFEVFQSGWSGAPYTGDHKESAGKSARLIRLTGEEDIDHLKYSCGNKRKETQFQAAKRLIMETARREGYGRARQLWLAPLPGNLCIPENLYSYGKQENAVSKLEDERKGNEPDRRESVKIESLPEGCVYIGLADDPSNQCRIPVYLPLDVHAVVCGLPMTGKSTFLQTVLYGITESVSPEEAWIYIIDYSNAALKAFEGMPHTGAVITEGQEQRCQALFHRLKKMMDERKQLFEGANYLQYMKTETAGKVPRIFIVIDNFASFIRKNEEAAEGILLRLCKEGPNAGITLLLSCGGFSQGELPLVYADYFKEAFCLEQKERFSYTEILGSLNIPVTPEKGIAGRGILRMDERILEFQTALCAKAPDDYERIRLITQQAAQRSAGYHGPRPDPVRNIPKKPALSEFLNDEDVKTFISMEDAIPIGYASRTAEIAFIDMQQFFCFLVSGRKKSGRHNLMKVILSGLIKKKQQGQDLAITVIDEGGSFASWRYEPLVDRYLDEYEKVASFFNEMTEKTDGSRHCVLIANLGELVNHAEDAGDGMTGTLEEMWEKRGSLPILFIALMEEEDRYLAGSLKSFKAFAAYRTGVHMGGSLTDDSFFPHESLTYSEQTAKLRAGCGHLFYADEKTEKVIIPQMENEQSLHSVFGRE